ncbi:MAG: RluA family pseudouridine synthase [Deltaproteobacteria bacterium]|jgi:23S rRNA pseudouridine1911/1915/1917 synthase|nr:RluA family pseudouridine synthase [Deltaproteobacteria bacterium]
MAAGHESEHDRELTEFFEFEVPKERTGQRLDQFLVEKLPDLSRNRISNLIKAEFISVNGRKSKSANRLRKGDAIKVVIPPPEPLEIRPEIVDFSILHEDDDLLVIAKPPGIVVHPAAGHKKGTLVHGILAHCEKLSGINGVERPGIVHRLDKDTSGVMVIAKSDRSHKGLVELFKSRLVKKVYYAIVIGGKVAQKGCVSQPIGRHPGNRKKMTVLKHGGREAVTCWSVVEELPYGMTYIEVRPETGRTHQIRAHMAFLGHPVAGDRLYGGKHQSAPKENIGIKRQCLHAYSLSFTHPVSGEPLEFVSPVWSDIQEVLDNLRQHSDQ